MDSKRLFIIFTAAILLLTLFLFGLNYKTKESKVENILYSHLSLNNIKYLSINKNYKILADNIYNLVINNAEVVNIFKDAKDATTIKRDIIRKKLSTVLEKKYQYIESLGFKQLQFYLPDSSTFFKMNSKSTVDDNLATLRYTVKKANDTLLPVSGYENAFRYIYPLFYNKEHIGSFGVTISKDTFSRKFQNDFFSKTQFLTENSIKFFLHIPYITKNKRHKRRLLEKLKTKKAFSCAIGGSKTISFIPVKELKNRDVSLYLLVYNENNNIESIEFIYMVFNVLIFLGLALFLYFLNQTYKYRISIEKANKELIHIKSNSDLGQNIANVGIWEIDYTSNSLLWSSGVHKIFQTDENNFHVSLESFMQFVYVDDREKLNKAYNESIKNRTDYFVEHRVVTKDGKLKYVEERCQNFFDKNQNILKSVGTILDVSERKRLEKSLIKNKLTLEDKVEDKIAELKKSTALFETIFDTVKDGVAIIDVESNFLLVNSAYEKMVLYTKEELYTKSCISLTIDSKIEKSKKAIELVLQKGYYGGFEKQCIAKDKSIIDVRMDLILMPDKKSILMVTKDITIHNRYKRELELQEQKLLQQSRLAQMGEMLSMIAHQWRQPLAAISSTSAALELKANLGKANNETVIKLSSKISEYAQHLSSTIDDFRDFFKSDKKELESSYNDIVKSILNIVEVSIENSNILIVRDLQDKEMFITYPNEVKQVILNLVKNAEDILIENNTEHAYIKIVTYMKNNRHILEVQDNAGGVPIDIVEKIFDPYFSTKLEKNGTGLGLYMSKTIIEEHCHGELNLFNNEEGAVFQVVLPQHIG